MSTDNRTFWILDTVSNPGAVIEEVSAGTPSNWRFFKGKSLASEFPSGATVKFSEEFPKQRKLFDFVANTLSLLIVSKKVRDILGAVGVDGCEYMPIGVRNHKDKLVGPDYFIVHPLGGEDGVDLEKSVYDKDPFDEKQIHLIHKLILKKEAISPNARLFRFKTLMRHYVVDQTVAEALQKSGVTGFRLLPAEGWNGSYLNLE